MKNTSWFSCGTPSTRGRSISITFLAAISALISIPKRFPPTSFEEVDLKLAQNRALGQRTEIKQAELNIRQAEYDRRMAKADYIPDVGIAFNYASNFNVDVLPGT